jgi:hypothetical protein
MALLASGTGVVQPGEEVQQIEVRLNFLITDEAVALYKRQESKTRTELEALFARQQAVPSSQ